ncbi:aspartate/glutamate racemase family protein [Marinobacterium sedimentorum]|uniref:aspartate/glutamate racemase family protein n=1 Tax=Marinobacterium sedimentorum TaxID=2927804 RepID=UPI0020C61CCC|nr:aspartate/glutamate racemase family protein [Marinobacterium sedimentorum]MCP8688998.1 aspartate/glutamate racemase family protein [Marinobacterium sedimentorum]
MNNTRPLRLLLINPNTNAALTHQMQQLAGTAISAQTQLHCINPQAGPHAIEGKADRDAAAAQLLALVNSDACQGYDALVLACFDDIELPALRASVRVPVIGLCEAAIVAARTLPGRFAIVTTVHAAVPGIKDMLTRYGAADQACVHAAGIGVAEAAGDGTQAAEKIAACIRTAIEQDGANTIVLGSGGLIGRAEDLQRSFGLPVIDPVLCALALAESLARLQLRSAS